MISTPRLPRYDLYGDADARSKATGHAEHSKHSIHEQASGLNFEWIPQRSKPYQFHIAAHQHSRLLQLLYLTRGSAMIHADTQVVQVKAPCLVLIPANIAHAFDFSRNVDGPVITVAQDELESCAQQLLPRLVSLMRQPMVLPLSLHDKNLAHLMSLFLAFEHEWRTPQAGQWAACMSLLINLLIQCERWASRSEQLVRVDTETSRKFQLMQAFRDLIERHCKEHWSMTQYAEKLSVSAGHLTRVCQQTVNQSALQLVNARLMHEAQRELLYSNLSIKQIAANLGFADESYFGRLFRQHVGQTLKQYRQTSRAV